MRESLPAHSCSIGELASFIEQAKGKIPVSVLWGAGASVSAGIPRASKFVKLFQQKYPLSYEKITPKEYLPLMAGLDDRLRQQLIIDFVHKAEVNWAHLALAQLLKYGFEQYVFTTNFDNLIERACHTIAYDQLSVYDLAAAPAFEFDMTTRPSLVYLHGKFSGFYLVNTEKDSKAQAEHVGRVLSEVKNHLWLVVGYSGENDYIFPEIQKIQRFRGGLYWTGIKNYSYWKPHVTGLCDGDRNAHPLSIRGADEFLAELSFRLMCFPPDLYLTPAKHVTSVLHPVPACKAPPLYGLDLTDFAHRSLTETLVRERAGNSSVVIRLLREMLGRPLKVAEVVLGNLDSIRTDPELMRFAGSACFRTARLLCKQAENDRDAIRDGIDAKSYMERYGEPAAVAEFKDAASMQDDDEAYFFRQWRQKVLDSRRCLELSDELGAIVRESVRSRLDKRVRQLETDVTKHKEAQPA